MKSIFLIGLFILLAGFCHSQPKSDLTLNKPGEFFVGCNYWASHAGTNMWNDWNENAVEKDFEQLSKNGIKVLRVFPIWSDFQPITNYYSGRSRVKEVRIKDKPLPEFGLGASGIDSVMMFRFREMANMASKYDIKLMVGLVTGFMSSRLFAPPALEGKNHITDENSLMWQIRFVKAFVKTMKDHPAILAWDLGNECNNLGEAVNYQQAYLWTAAISNAIKSSDNTRLVISGMHGLSASDRSVWRIRDQGELTDILTTHPYPMWTPYANQDPVTSIRTIMHSVAETRLYADIAKKPCLVEETGVMGPQEAGENETSEFCRSIAFNLWANDCHGVMWWCAYDQGHLSHPPYDWTAVEVDLGLFRSDREPKKVANVLKEFSGFLEKFPYKELPERKTDAVCILTEGTDQWAIAYSSYILSKQAGFELEFQQAEQELKESKIYLLPSISGTNVVSRHSWLKLLEKVKAGASLYISSDGGFLSPFLKEAGITINTSETRVGTAVIQQKSNETLSYTIASQRKYDISLSGATLLAQEKDGNPAYTVNSYGKGKIFFLTVPIETYLIKTPNSFSEKAPEYWKIYSEFANEVVNAKIVQKNNPYLSCTEHFISDKAAVIVIVNNSNKDISTTLTINKEWSISKSFYGQNPQSNLCQIRANDALVLIVKK